MAGSLHSLKSIIFVLLVHSLFLSKVTAAGWSCASRCKEPYNKNDTCHCNDRCGHFENCCDDFIQICIKILEEIRYVCWESNDINNKCQCNSHCGHYGHGCSHDFLDKCNASCADRCFDDYNNTDVCHCDDNCEAKNNCCPDFNDTCHGTSTTNNDVSAELYTDSSSSSQSSTPMTSLLLPFTSTSAPLSSSREEKHLVWAIAGSVSAVVLFVVMVIGAYYKGRKDVTKRSIAQTPDCRDHLKHESGNNVHHYSTVQPISDYNVASSTTHHSPVTESSRSYDHIKGNLSSMELSQYDLATVRILPEPTSQSYDHIGVAEKTMDLTTSQPGSEFDIASKRPLREGDSQGTHSYDHVGGFDKPGLFKTPEMSEYDVASVRGPSSRVLTCRPEDSSYDHICDISTRHLEMEGTYDIARVNNGTQCYESHDNTYDHT